MTDKDIKIIIKSPNHKVSDVPISCQLTWTVKELKQKISDIYPENPALNQQRLIYSGKLLVDHERLSKYIYIKSVTDEYVVHLVLTKREPTRASPPTCNKDQLSNSDLPDTCKAIAARFNFSVDEFVRLQYEYQQYVVEKYRSSIIQRFSVSHLDNRPPPIDHPAVAASLPAVAGLSPRPQSDEPRPPPPYEAHPPANDEVPPADDLPVGNLFVGANFVPPRADNGVRRDGIDLFYAICRVFFLSAFVYYYSSLDKALVSVVLFGLIVLLQDNFWRDRIHRMWLMLRISVSNPPAVPEFPQPTPPAAAEEAQRPGSDANPPSPAVMRTYVHGLTAFCKAILGFLVTFITSLVPERPPAIDAN